MNNPPDQLETDLGSISDHSVRNGDQSGATSRSGCGCTKIVLLAVAFLLLIAAGMWFAIAEAQRIPDFYAHVLHADHPQAKIDGQQFERSLIRLQNSARQRKPWKVEISQDQFNGWLANDLPQKFPDSIPSEIIKPRAVFDHNEVKLAFQYKVNRIQSIIVVTANIFCTDQPNEIAVEILGIRAGLIPLPVGPWIDKISDSLRQAGVPLFWTTTADSPVAVFSIPEHLSAKGNNQQVVIEAIELSLKKLVIAGRTEEFAPAENTENRGRGPVDQNQKSTSPTEMKTSARENPVADKAKTLRNGPPKSTARKKSDANQKKTNSSQ